MRAIRPREHVGIGAVVGVEGQQQRVARGRQQAKFVVAVAGKAVEAVVGVVVDFAVLAVGHARAHRPVVGQGEVVVQAEAVRVVVGARVGVVVASVGGPVGGILRASKAEALGGAAPAVRVVSKEYEVVAPRQRLRPARIAVEIEPARAAEAFAPRAVGERVAQR